MIIHTVDHGLPDIYAIEPIVVKEDIDPKLLIVEQGNDTIVFTRTATQKLIEALQKI